MHGVPGTVSDLIFQNCSHLAVVSEMSATIDIVLAHKKGI